MAGAVLVGVKPHNRGLRIRVSESQATGESGPVRGLFRILTAGDNPHTEVLSGLLGQELDADGLLRVLRLTHRHCVNAVNAGALALEATP